MQFPEAFGSGNQETHVIAMISKKSDHGGGEAVIDAPLLDRSVFGGAPVAGLLLTGKFIMGMQIMQLCLFVDSADDDPQGEGGHGGACIAWQVAGVLSYDCFLSRSAEE